MIDEGTRPRRRRVVAPGLFILLLLGTGIATVFALIIVAAAVVGT